MYKGDDDDDGAGVSDGDDVGSGGSPLKIRLNINELSLPTAHHLRLGIHAFLRQWLRVGARAHVCRKVCWCKINAGERWLFVVTLDAREINGIPVEQFYEYRPSKRLHQPDNVFSVNISISSLGYKMSRSQS